MIEKFNIHINDKDIVDLRDRIKKTRWPDEINNNAWSHGTSLNFLKDLSEYWLDEFNWRHHEDSLNKVGSYKFTSSSGLKIHYLHSKSYQEGAVPLMMTHGWPGSIQEFLKIIPILRELSLIHI